MKTAMLSPPEVPRWMQRLSPGYWLELVFVFSSVLSHGWLGGSKDSQLVKNKTQLIPIGFSFRTRWRGGPKGKLYCGMCLCL